MSFDTTFTETTTIPDESHSGALFSRTITGSDIGLITSLKVTLNLNGGWNGDLFVYVAHESGFAVLLNRIGRDGMGSGFGSDTFGMTATFDDAGVDGDIHTASFLPREMVTGVFAPDGRTVGDVSNNSERTAFLSSFNGLAGDGLWELFVADVSGGETSQLLSWGVSMEGTSISIPEPSSLLTLSGLLAAGLGIRHRRSGK